MAVPPTSDYHYEHWNTLKDLLSDIADLRRAYRRAPKAGMAAADRAERSIQGLLRSEDIRRLLDDRLGSQPPITAALSRARVSDTQVDDEARLAVAFGYAPSEARRYIEAAYRNGRPPMRIASADDLSALLSQLHSDVRGGLQPNGGWWARRRAAKQTQREADRRLFCVGAIVADILRPDLFRVSYEVGASTLVVADG